MCSPLVLVVTKRQTPPTLRSISQTESVQARGPRPQRLRSSGLVKQSKTSLRGASKTRIRAISRSFGVVTFSVAVPVGVIVLVLCFASFYSLRLSILREDGRGV